MLVRASSSSLSVFRGSTSCLARPARWLLFGALPAVAVNEVVIQRSVLIPMLRTAKKMFSAP